MLEDAWVDFSGRVSCVEHLHVDAVPLAWPPAEAMQLRLVERNGSTLAALAALEEHAPEAPDDDSAVMQEMLRLDAKLTALVEIVNQLLVPSAELPPRHLLRFNAVGAVVPSALVPAGCAAVLLRPRFDVCPALSLELAAQIGQQFPDGSRFLAFTFMGEAASDAFERLVFRHHRRKVAGARQLGA